jgi:transcriptional regulator with XRE-family HTH domain
MTPAKIKVMRKFLGMTQIKFAGTLGISQGFLSDLEKGSKNPSKSLSLLLKKFEGDQTVDFDQKIVSVDEATSQNKTYNEISLKLKYVALMEEHVKALSEIIKLKEEISNIKAIKVKAV